MWPSVPAYRAYENVACPAGVKCELPYCIFKHHTTIVPPMQHAQAYNNAVLDRNSNAHQEQLIDTPREPAALLIPPPEQTTSNVFVGSIVSKQKPSSITQTQHKTTSSKPVTKVDPSTALPRSATLPVSPPPTRTAANQIAKSDTPVSLMPRKLNKESTTFTKRITLLKALHAYMKPLNDKIAKAVKSEIKTLHLSSNDLIRVAVEEEEKIAKEHGLVYENILKQRLVKLKAMTPELWVKERREALAKERGELPRKTPPKRVDTGLSSKDELTFLSLLKCPLTGLDLHGYVIKPPTAKELEEARKAHASADHWEECDRCSSRFQVFPERRQQDGALTTGGQCKYHWGKRIFPKRVANALPEPTRLTCCNEPVGSPGCTTHDTHVYNVKDTKRLSLTMPFIETPHNDNASIDSAVCFDCEMGYTTNGLEMLRLTVITWPAHRPLIDVLVRPLGHLLDVNTRFSGVTAEQFVNAKPYDPDNPKPVRNDLRIVDSPYVARNLFLSHISPSTPVLGHALENDLNTIRVIHPTIVDTVLLFPTRQGLPYRHGLRFLAKTHLGEEIQQGGAAGHDSFEDARTTGELIRYKIKEKWKTMKVDGWQIRGEGVFPPIPNGSPPLAKATVAPSMIPVATMAMLEDKPAPKRKLEDDEGDVSDDRPPTKK